MPWPMALASLPAAASSPVAAPKHSSSTRLQLSKISTDLPFGTCRNHPSSVIFIAAASSTGGGTQAFLLHSFTTPRFQLIYRLELAVIIPPVLFSSMIAPASKLCTTTRSGSTIYPFGQTLSNTSTTKGSTPYCSAPSQFVQFSF
eukprot:scaffold230343_cov36-Cyclotella_meneghiniana.AAC.1